MNDNKQKYYKQPKQSQGHIPKNEDEFLQCLFVCNSNNNCYDIYYALRCLNNFKFVF